HMLYIYILLFNFILNVDVALYGECRAFLTCIKENHGGIFRLVVFSSLLDPEKKLKTFQQQELNAKAKSKGAHAFARHDATSSSGKGTLLRDLSEDADLDRQGSTSQQLQAVGTDEASTPNIASSTFSMKLK
ncbi:unnamed protein product, partial [Adineta steineri]